MDMPYRGAGAFDNKLRAGICKRKRCHSGHSGSGAGGSCRHNTGYKVFPLPVLRLQPVPMGPGENARILPGLRRTIDTAQKKLSRLNKTGAVRDRFLCILPGIYINFIDFENII